jgi:dihydroneopterin aldolase
VRRNELLKVNIQDLTFDCIIGILPIEREKEQRVILNINFEYYFKEDGSNLVDYSDVVSFVETTMKEEKFRLIEDAILHLRRVLRNRYEIVNLHVKIAKPDILSNCIVSVEE